MAKLPEKLIGEQLKREIREIVEDTVRETVREMKKSGLLKRADDVAYSEISARLYDFFKEPERDPEMAAALETISGDYYAQSLRDYYEDHLSLDIIAVAYHCDLTTIKRNKKRLCLQLYKILQ